MAKIILLNGVSSAGKSTLARQIQELASKAFLHVQMDAFLSMMPPRYANHPDAFAFVKEGSTNTPEMAVFSGEYGKSLMRGMRRSILALASQGLNIVVDDVMLDNDIEDYRSLFAHFDFFAVKVDCDLADAQAREKARGDRGLGLARWQYSRVHERVSYDFVVNTSMNSPNVAAQLIVDQFNL
jgi:chloramphenicol 3-O phosphotransferase